MKLTEGLYSYVWQGNDNNCNTFLFANVLTNSKHIIIDPGHIITPYLHEKAYDTLIQEINADGLKPADIGMVLLTHAHPDHMESAKKFKDNIGAIIGINNDDEPVYRMFGGLNPDFSVPIGELKYQNIVKSKIEIYHTPGHSPGHTAIYWPEKLALAVGDVIFFHNTGRVDLPGGSPEALKNSIDLLSKLEVEYLLCGHPYDNPGVIVGKEAVKKNFDFVKSHIWF